MRPLGNFMLFGIIRDYRAHCSARAILELKLALSVTIIDLCWGRTDYLWQEVAKELCFSLEPYDDEPYDD